MNRLRTIATLIFLTLSFVSMSQDIPLECEMIHVIKNEKRRGVFYGDALPLKIYNSKKEFGVLVLGKQEKKSPFLFLKIYSYNTCVENNSLVRVLFTDNTEVILRNLYRTNCEGMFIAEFGKENAIDFQYRTINTISVFSFQKDFEMPVSSENAQKIRTQTQCLVGKD